MSLNDAAIDYETERVEPNDPITLARLRVEQIKSRRGEEPPTPPTPPPKESRSFLEDVGKGITETIPQVLGGFLDATKEVALMLEDKFPLGTVGGDDFNRDTPNLVDEADSVTGGLVRGVSQFLTGFIPAVKGFKALGAAGGLKTAMAAGALSDALVFDPHEERLSNLIQEQPLLANPISEYLAASDDDSEAEGRFKNALEGLALGGLVDGLFKTVKLMREGRKANVASKEQRQADTKLKTEAEKEVAAEIKTPKEEIEKAFGTGDLITPVKDDPDKAININLNRLDTEDDVKELIRLTADAHTKEIQKARRGTIDHEQTQKLADTLGMTPDELINRKTGVAFNAEQALAARKLLTAASAKTIELAKIAQTSGRVEDKFSLLKAVTYQRAIQEQVHGITAEAGRALGSFRIVGKTAKAQQDMINDVVSSGGKSVDEMVEALAMANNPAAINQIVEKAAKASKGEAIVEAWYPAILSGPGTHVVNIVGNSLNVFWNAGVRVMTPAIGRAFGDQETTYGEFAQSMYGAFQGAKDGLVFAGMALKSSDFQLTGQGTIEKFGRGAKRAISKETFNQSGAIGQGIDYIGSFIRTPTRMLTAGDAFFRAINNQMELRALSFRQATEEGLTGKKAAIRMQQIMTDPPEEILKQAEHFSRVQTFTNDLGKAGQGLQQFANNNAFAKLLMPFIRTPVNIIKTVGVNSPVAPFAKSVRADIAAGGARRDKAIAQISLGSTVMGVTSMLAAEGTISGGGPADRNLKRTLELSGWKPYSVKLGDTYYSYNRLDPIGAMMGIAADYSEISGNASDADLFELTGTLIFSTAKNLSSKTYLQGISRFFGALQQVSSDPDKESRPMKNFLVNLASGFVPFSGLQSSIERVMDPTTRATEGLIERIKSRTPGFSEDLPPVLNVFGEPVMNGGGLGPDIMSPVYTSVAVEDPVVDELVRLGMPMTMPPKSIEGIRLSTQEYHDLVLISAKMVKEDNKDYKAYLRAEMKTSSYKREPLEAKKLIITRITAGFRKAAKAIFLDNNPNFSKQLEEQKAQRALELTGQ